MTRSVFKGDSVVANVGNSEGLTPGKVYIVTREAHSSDALVYVNNGEMERLCFYDPKGSANSPYDVRKVTPVVAPVDLMSPEELVLHQQDVVVEALSMWCDSTLGRMKGKPTVVGGAPRDWDYNIPAQDIDIWVKNSQFGEEDLNTLKKLFEPKGATVGQVTNNTYARDGEYIHYIFNVMWQGVDLQFIFVEDSSVKAVTDHVCCNFSEIAWDWQTRMLEPNHVYKAGRTARTLVFRDDKGRSPRECYIKKMSDRYPDHTVVLPNGKIQGTMTEWVPDEPISGVRYVEALETSHANRITQGHHYKVLKDDGRFWDIKGDEGRKVGVYKDRFKVVVGSPKKPEVTRKGDQPIPEGYTKCIVLVPAGTAKGNYWKGRGEGITPNRELAYVYTGKPSGANVYINLIWIE